ncbi:cell agglutination protein Mam3 [Podospora pseudopauciseta]|uniref:Cell agglutination protein Mam3 n=2 Tax=Podospora TaxID=5144 RepID=A0ABR0HCV9_9PEZI|nr:cell agglutination protein Mam3 [Podospora pseudopauciseta]KAK4676967.1 cell agglutination protein Mam3 [Podospora pseudoanserina]
MTTMRQHGVTAARPNSLFALRSGFVGLARILSLTLSTAYAAPIASLGHGGGGNDEPDAGGASLGMLYLASAILVLSGGAFAGLTIALMGQDSIYLQVMAGDATEPQQKNAKRVYHLLEKGKHWVLVTLLLANVIVNETLPVVLDRCLGGGIAAVIGSTVLIVIFGEVVPQSVCVRYGLQIGGYMSKPVLAMMYLTAPISWPIAILLDKILGKDHGTVYKKSGLKTLVTLHKNLGDMSQRLNQDEVTIISAVLDLKEKPVANVMTPMADVFVMAEDTVLDEKTMDMILSAGYSRIPIHETGNPTNFVGMLLVKILITYDPEDAKLVKDFPLATLPETRPETSCLDIVNFFQEGKSHMVLVSEYPGEDHGALGVVTLEDVIEELIGEEIIDESDVYIDVHKAIRRLQPAPKARVQRRQSEDQAGRFAEHNGLADHGGDLIQFDTTGTTSFDSPALSSSPKLATLMMRRSSAGREGHHMTVPVRANFEDIRQHLKHLGPSNPATNPRDTKSTTVKIKPGTGLLHTAGRSSSVAEGAIEESPLEHVREHAEEEEGDETTSLLNPQVTGKDGIQALQQTYGATSPVTVQLASPINGVPTLTLETPDQADKSSMQNTKQSPTESTSAGHRSVSSGDSTHSARNDVGNLIPAKPYVRSGSITENIVESRGVRKVVLETTSSNDEDEFAVIGTSPEQPKSRSTFGLFGRTDAATKNEGVGEEEEEEELLSPETGEEGTSKGADVAKGNGAPGTAAGGPSSGGGGAKKKNKRKKRKGGKS